MAKEINIFVLNCGSSSLKYKMITMPSEKELFGGEVQRIGSSTSLPSQIIHEVNGNEELFIVTIRNYIEAFNEVMKIVENSMNIMPDIIAHRLVKGQPEINGDTFVNKLPLSALDKIKELAPVHNPPVVEIIKSCLSRYPFLPQTVILDTTFHSTIPDYASAYALPKKLCEDLGIKKYGFHGISHKYVSVEAAEYLGIPVESFNAVSCHLGSGGASLCAIRNGISIDNTMGFTPLQGLVMSTRSGNLDPAIILRMVAYSEGNSSKVNNILNKKSGVLGLSGSSSDIRDIIANAENNSRAQTTLDVYLWRIKKYLGKYLTLLGRTDSIIFTDTIGETMPFVREQVCKNMEYWGIKMDAIKNKNVKIYPCDISGSKSKMKIIVVKTNEELAIARSAYNLKSSNNKKTNDEKITSINS